MKNKKGFYKLFAIIINLIFNSIMYSQYGYIIKNPTSGLENGVISINLNGDTNPWDISLIQSGLIMSEIQEYKGPNYDFGNLAGGSYQVKIKDYYDCETTLDIDLLEVDCLPVNIVLEEIKHNLITGIFSEGLISISLDTDIPIADLNIKWTDVNNNVVSTDSTILNFLTNGEYKVEISKKNSDCIFAKTFRILSCFSYSDFDNSVLSGTSLLPEIDLEISTKNPSAIGGNNGSITIQFEPFNILHTLFLFFENPDGSIEEVVSDGNSFNNLQAGRYFYEFDNGCAQQSDFIYLAPCDNAVYSYDIVPNEINSADNICSPQNSIIINIYKDGNPIVDETALIEIINDENEKESISTNDSQITIDNLKHGLHMVSIFTGCSNEPFSVDIDFSNNCETFSSLSQWSEFSGVEFEYFRSGPFGANDNRQGWKIKFSDMSAFFQNGCSYTIEYFLERSGNFSPSVFANAQSYGIISGETERTLSYPSAPVRLNAIISSSSGCVFEFSTRFHPVVASESQSSDCSDTNSIFMTPILDDPSTFEIADCRSIYLVTCTGEVSDVILHVPLNSVDDIIPLGGECEISIPCLLGGREDIDGTTMTIDCIEALDVQEKLYSDFKLTLCEYTSLLKNDDDANNLYRIKDIERVATNSSLNVECSGGTLSVSGGQCNFRNILCMPLDFDQCFNEQRDWQSNFGIDIPLCVSDLISSAHIFEGTDPIAISNYVHQLIESGAIGCDLGAPSVVGGFINSPQYESTVDLCSGLNISVLDISYIFGDGERNCNFELDASKLLIKLNIPLLNQGDIIVTMYNVDFGSILSTGDVGYTFNESVTIIENPSSYDIELEIDIRNKFEGVQNYIVIEYGSYMTQEIGLCWTGTGIV